jgi:uncharacterized protein (TIGR03083 family)
MIATPNATTGRPRRLPVQRSAAMRLARTEYERVSAALANLEDADWHLPTACPEWDVRELGCHLVGMAAMASTPLEIARQQKAAKAVHATRGGPMIDSLTHVQVSERATWRPEQVVAGAASVGPRAVRGRRLLLTLAGRAKLADPQQVNGRDELWTIGYLLGTILTRDPWMHRMDLARATGREPVLTADHDGVIVDDVVREWAGRHGRPYRLELTGAAGGRWASAEQPSNTETISMDTIDFCRILSGRATGVGLLTTQVAF